MAINGIPGRVNTSEIEPAVERSRPIGPGATPALQSSSGLTGRMGLPPDATLRRATVPTMATAQAVVPLNQAASRPKFSLGELFRMEDEQDRRTLEGRVGRRLDSNIDKGIVSRALEGHDMTDASPSPPGPHTSRRLPAPAGHAAAQPAVSEASGGTGEPAAAGLSLTRRSRERPRADSPVQAIADPWQAEDSQRPQMAVSSRQPRPISALAGTRPSIPEKRKVGFAGAEQREFDPDDNRKALEEPVQVPFPSDAVVAARGKSPEPSSSEAAHANMAANDADKKARIEYATQLSVAVGRLQSLALESPGPVQQTIQSGVLPAEVLGDRLDPQFVEDVLDLHTQFNEWQATAPALAQIDAEAGKPRPETDAAFIDAGGVATIIVKARQAFAERAQNQAALLAMMAETGETSVPPVPRELNADQIRKVTSALNGGGQALRRMSERAERVNAEPAKTALGRMRQALGKPKRLEGARRKDFVALVDRDIAALVTKLRIEPRHAADLLQRAVHAGQMGADALRPQDRSLLLEVLAAKALNGGG